MAYQNPNSMRTLRTPATAAPATGETPVILAMRRNKAGAASGEIATGDWSQGVQVPTSAASIPTVPEQPYRPGIPRITSPTPKPAAEIFSTLGTRPPAVPVSAGDAMRRMNAEATAGNIPNNTDSWAAKVAQNSREAAAARLPQLATPSLADQIPGNEGRSPTAVPAAPTPAAGYNDPRGWLTATRANLEASDEGMRKAQGFWQNAGAAVSGAAKIAGGAILDAGDALVNRPLRALAPITNDVYKGATGNNLFAPVTPATPAAPAPAVAAAPDQSAAETARLANAPVVNSMRDTLGTSPAIQPYSEEADARTQGLRKQISALRQAEDERGSLGSGVIGGDWSAQVARRNAETGASSVVDSATRRTAIADLANLNEIEKSKPGIQAGLRQGLMQDATTRRGQDVTERDNMRTVEGQMATARGLRQFEAQKMKLEQDNKDREYKRGVSNDNFTQGQAADDHVNKMLDARFTTGTDREGKPVVDVAGKNRAFAGIQRSLAALGGESMKDLSPQAREQLMAGAELVDKVNKEATNWPIPWKPDYIKSVLPHDLVGMTLEDGNYVIQRGAAKGQRIPARFVDKEQADHLYGQPTNKNDSLKAR